MARAKRVTDLPSAAEATDTPTCSEAQKGGAQGRSVMRSVGLDLGARHIAFCEVVDGVVVRRASVRRLSELEPMLGRKSPSAQVAFEASREGWHVHDVLSGWGKQPVMLDTTRVQQIGVGQHGRKNDAIDAEAMALALDAGRVPVAHVLSPERRALRAQLSVRGELVEMRARQVTLLRGLARAAGVLVASSSTDHFLQKLQEASLDPATRALMAPLVATLTVAQEQLAAVDKEIAQVAKGDPIIRLCATAPGVALIVSATFVSVIDEAKRFRNAHAVSAYLGLVPGENTTGGKRRLGSITKHGNTHARLMLVQSAWQILRAGDADDPCVAGPTPWPRRAARRSPPWRWPADSRACSGRCGATAPSTTPACKRARAPRACRPMPKAKSSVPTPWHGWPRRFSAANARQAVRRAPRRRGHAPCKRSCLVDAPSSAMLRAPSGSDDRARPGERANNPVRGSNVAPQTAARPASRTPHCVSDLCAPHGRPMNAKSKSRGSS